MKKKKFLLEELLKKMDFKQRIVCDRIRGDFASSFDVIPGSSHNHQAWRGGYKDHIEEIMNVACVLYESLGGRRKLRFSLSDALFLLFLHDMDKVFHCEVTASGFLWKSEYTKSSIKEIEKLLKKRYRYSLREDQINALKYVHGEGKGYSLQKRVMNPLSAFIHCCDIISARIWFNKGRDDEYW